MPISKRVLQCAQNTSSVHYGLNYYITDVAACPFGVYSCRCVVSCSSLCLSVQIVLTVQMSHCEIYPYHELLKQYTYLINNTSGHTCSVCAAPAVIAKVIAHQLLTESRATYVKLREFFYKDNVSPWPWSWP